VGKIRTETPGAQLPAGILTSEEKRSMSDKNLATLNDNSDSAADALLPVSVGPHSNGEWEGAVVPAPLSGPSGPDVMVFAHALRRHWLLSLGIGLLCAAILSPLVYIAIGEKYTSFSRLIISMQETPLVFKNEVGMMDKERFEIFKSTQMTKLVSRPVLKVALDKPEVAKLPFIREETDPEEWLEKRLSIFFPGRAEVMTVSLTRNNPKEAQVLVKAVVEAYMSEVVDAEAAAKQQKLSDLEKLYSEREQDLRKKREALKSMAEGTGGSGAEVFSMRQKLMVEELQLHRTQAVNVEYSIQSVKNDLAAQRAVLKTVDSTDISAAELTEMVRADPIAGQILSLLTEKQKEQRDNQGVVKSGVRSGYVRHFEDDVARLQSQYDMRVEQIKRDAREKNRHTVEKEIVRLDSLLKTMGQHRATVAKNVKQMTSEASSFGVISVGMEMLRSDIGRLDTIQAQINTEIERLKVEIKSIPRIRMWEPAIEPLGPSNTTLRIAATALLGLTGLCFPGLLVVLWDARIRRINTTKDVSQGLQLPVIGSVPLIPARVIRQLGSPSPRHRAWHLRLTESVDGIAARLLHKADMEQCRVIMVSSAAGGEGKTTLATQLALSLARTGRQVVLVDFDLRRPSFDELFGVPLAPGVSETLRHESEVYDLVHPTSTDNLAVVTAGRWNRQALASLSNGGADAMFKQLRESFEFVVVDTSPILPVADARFVSKFVDTVVLSVFRDVSEAPKIQAACDILAAFGVRSVEAVVTGQGSEMYGKHTGYESTVSA
jgi:polysaccharide biosynthesis transport protein